MKVIKEGTAHFKNITCDRCESELQYEPKDMYYEKDVYLDREEYFYYIDCPVCGKTINVDKRVVKYAKPKKQKWWQWFIEDSDWPPM